MLKDNLAFSIRNDWKLSRSEVLHMCDIITTTWTDHPRVQLLDNNQPIRYWCIPGSSISVKAHGMQCDSSIFCFSLHFIILFIPSVL